MPGTNLTRSEAAERAALLGNCDYRVELDVTTGETTFTSRTTVTFSCHEPGATSFIDLIAPTVRSVVLNGEELDPQAVFADSRITLANLDAENTLVVEAECAYSRTGEGLHRFVDPVDGEVYLYTQFEVADCRRMFAVFEQPDLKAHYTLDVTAPAHWELFSNSPTPEPTPVREGVARWQFTPTEYLSCYLVALVAGPYAGARGELTSIDGRTIPLGVFCRSSLVEYLDAEEIMDITRRGFEVFEEAYGQPYPFRKYDQIFTPEFNAGAMENAGCVTIVEQYVFDSRPLGSTIERRAITILHELGHMWFGDLVTMKWWDDLWLNESFAEYVSHYAAVENTRWEDAWTTFLISEKTWALEQDQLPSTHPIAADIRDLEDVLVNFDGITYGKGASVLQQLVAWVGRDAFLEGVRAYFVKKKWGNAQLSDLLVELEKSSGRDLTEWTKLWLQESGVSTLELAIEGDGVVESAVVRQYSHDGRASNRPHHLAIGVYELTPEGRVVCTESIELDVEGAETPVPQLVGKARTGAFVLDHEAVAFAKWRLDPVSFDFAAKHINAFDNRLARTMVLASATDMANDGQLKPSAVVDLFANALETEEHPTVLGMLCRTLQTNLKARVAWERREELTAATVDRLLEWVRASQPGSDRQFQLFRTVIELATTPEQLAAITAWLDGTDSLEGIDVDQGVRWAILRRLAGKSEASQIAARIDAELEHDKTANGQAYAALCRAALRDPETKKVAFESILGIREVSNTIQRDTAMGFNDGDPALLTPFVTPYFEALESQWAERTVEMATNTIRAFPTALIGYPGAEVDVLEIGRTWLAEHKDSAAPAMYRLVSEAMARAERLAKLQAIDAE